MKLSLVMILVAGLVVVGATPAFACSCMPSSPADIAARNDAAFVGTYLGRTEPPGPMINTGSNVVNHFSVERVIKGGPIPGNVDVLAAYSGASCGLELGVGQRVGLGLMGSPAEWHSNLCNQADADGMLALAQPVNPPPPPPPAPPVPAPVAPSPKASATPKAQPTPARTASPVATPSRTPEASPTPTPSPSATSDEVGLTSEKGSGPPWIPILLVAGLLAVGAGIALGFRSRRRPGSEPT